MNEGGEICKVKGDYACEYLGMLCIHTYASGMRLSGTVPVVQTPRVTLLLIMLVMAVVRMGYRRRRRRVVVAVGCFGDGFVRVPR